MSKVETFLVRRIRPLPVGRQRGWRKDKAIGKSSEHPNKGELYRMALS